MAYAHAIFHNFYPCNFKAQFSEFSGPNFSKALIILSLTTANKNYSTTGLIGFFLKYCSVLISSPRTCEPASAVQTTLAATASQKAQKALAAKTALTAQTALAGQKAMTAQNAFAAKTAKTAQTALAGQKAMTDQTTLADQTASAAQTIPADQTALADQTASASRTASAAQTDSADQTALLAQNVSSSQTTLAASGEPASAAQTASVDQTVLATQTASAASGLPQLHQNAQLDSTSYPAFHSAQTEYHSQSNVQHIEPFYRYRVYSDAS